MDVTTKPGISPEVLDQLLAGYERPVDLTGDDGLFRRLKKALRTITEQQGRSWRRPIRHRGLRQAEPDELTVPWSDYLDRLRNGVQVLKPAFGARRADRASGSA